LICVTRRTTRPIHVSNLVNNQDKISVPKLHDDCGISQSFILRIKASQLKSEYEGKFMNGTAHYEFNVQLNSLTF
jgi:hypothetical protein